MASRSYVAAPGVYINEQTTKSYIVAPAVYVKETAPAAPVVTIAAGGTLPMVGVG